MNHVGYIGRLRCQEKYFHSHLFNYYERAVVTLSLVGSHGFTVYYVVIDNDQQSQIKLIFVRKRLWFNEINFFNN